MPERPAKLNKPLLDRLAAEARKDPSISRRVYDPVRPGFHVRLRRGRLDFGYAYRVGGREKRLGLGVYGPTTLEAAIARYRPAYDSVQGGGDPMGERRASRERSSTFADVAAAYLADLEKRAATGAKRGRKSTLREFRGLLDRHVLPRLGSKEIEAVELEDIEAVHRALWETPASANRALTVISAVIGYAERRRFRPIGSNPCQLVERLKESPQAPRFSVEELHDLGTALRDAEAADEISPGAVLAVKLLALTGARRSEIISHALVGRRPEGGGGLRWRDIDLVARTALLRDAKAGDRLTPLAAPVVSLLAAARPGEAPAEAPVCPGRRSADSLTNLEKPWTALLSRAGLKPRGLHALRRTFGSVAGDLGLGEYLVGALLGHARQGVTGRYVIPAQDPVRDAAERVAAVIAEAMGLDGRELAKVLPMAGNR